MSRWEPIVFVFLGIALLWGFGAAWLADAADWSPLVAPASIVLVAAAFGWARRGRELIDIGLPAIAVTYAAYVGLAIARMSQPNLIAAHYRMDPLIDRLPGVLLGGLPFALFMTVFIALPVSMIPLRRKADAVAAADADRFWTFVRAENAAHAQPPHPSHDEQRNGIT